jgi:citrate lyase beta subunit
MIPAPRSALFVPALRERAISRAASAGADMLILDLEDATGPDEKTEARNVIATTLDLWSSAQTLCAVRINAPDTDHWRNDLEAAQNADAIVVPKILSADDLQTVRAAMGDDTPLWAMIETPESLLNLRDIAQAAIDLGVAGLIAGTNDLSKSLRLPSGSGRFGLIPHLAQIVASGRAGGVHILDGVYNAYKDTDGFAREAEEGRNLGFDGKTLIHPGQVAAANSAFGPNEAEIDWAKRVITAFNDPANSGKGVIALDGEMIERLHLVRARAIHDRKPDGDTS